MIKTKILLNALNKDGTESLRTRFLVPTSDVKTPLRCIKDGKTYDMGYVVYIGRAITVEDFFAGIGFEIDNGEEQKKDIERYFEQLKNFKIANVVKIVVDENKGFNLELVAKSYRGLSSS